MEIFKIKNTPRIKDYVELFTKVEKVIESLDNFNQLGSAYKYLSLFDKFLDDSLFKGCSSFNKGTVEYILQINREDLRRRIIVRENQLFEDYLDNKTNKR